MEEPEYWQNYLFLYDSIEFQARARPKASNKIPKRYLESDLSSQQIADEFGVSKQFVLTQLRKAGIRKAPGRGRSPENYRFHNPPYGFRVRNQKLESDQREMKVVRLIVELKDRQGKSFPETAQEINTRGWKNRKGGEWTKVAVQYLHKRWTGKI